MREVKIDVILTLNFDGCLYLFRQSNGMIPVLQMYNFETSESRFYIDLVIPITTKINNRKVMPVLIQ